MYGMCKIVDPELRVCELSHTVPKFDVVEAGRRLTRVMPYWPEGTVFVSVVDPGVGTPRRACVVKTRSGRYIVTPDNGTLAEAAKLFGIAGVRELDESVNRYPHTKKVSIFHGRDLFAYCAARLASGIIAFDKVGPEYPAGEIVGAEGVGAERDGEDCAAYCENSTFTEAPKNKVPVGRMEAEDINADRRETPAIVMINDCGYDGRAAVFRGICESVCPGAEVYDICRDMPAGDPTAAAEALRTAVCHWPAGTVFVCAIGDGEPGGRAYVAEDDGGRFVVTNEKRILEGSGIDFGRINDIRTGADDFFGFDLSGPEALVMAAARFAERSVCSICITMRNRGNGYNTN